MSGYSTSGLTAATFPLTGNELIAADTQLTQGLSPESEAISVSQLRGFYRAPVALTDGATIATNTSSSETFTVTLGGNRTLSNPTSLTAGQTYKVIVTQDATGARTLAYGTAYKFSGSSTLTTTAGAIDMLTFTSVDGTNVLGTLATKFA
jgi:hypothetical protein